MTPADALQALETLGARGWSLRVAAGGYVVEDGKGRRVYPQDGAVAADELDRAVIDGAVEFDARTAEREEHRAARLVRDGFAQGVHPRPRTTTDGEGNPATAWDLHDASGAVLSADHESPSAALLASTKRGRP